MPSTSLSEETEIDPIVISSRRSSLDKLVSDNTASVSPVMGPSTEHFEFVSNVSHRLGKNSTPVSFARPVLASCRGSSRKGAKGSSRTSVGGSSRSPAGGSPRARAGPGVVPSLSSAAGGSSRSPVQGSSKKLMSPANLIMTSEGRVTRATMSALAAKSLVNIKEGFFGEREAEDHVAS